MAHAIVDLQGLHLGDTFRCPNISASVGLKSFHPLCFKLDGNTETIAVHFWKVHYRMAIMCNICWAFASMTTQSILDHHSGSKVRCNKEHVEHEGNEKAQTSHMKKKSKSHGQKEASQLLRSDAAKK